MLASPSGHLQPVAASTERIRLLELFELQNQDGPCLDAFRTGETVIAADLEQERERWPNFATEALQVGFRAAHSIPMRLRDDTIGAINLLRINTGDLTGEDTKLARAARRHRNDRGDPGAHDQPIEHDNGGAAARGS